MGVEPTPILTKEPLMLVLTALAATLQTLFTTEADALASETGFVRRKRAFTGATFVQTLVFGWLHQPHASLDDLAEVAADLGVEVSPQAIDQRLGGPAAELLVRLLATALHHAWAAEPTAVPLLQRFTGVHVFDTTTMALPAALAALFPGCGGSTPADGQAALKCHTEIELRTGALDLVLGPGRQPDAGSELARRPLPPGSLRLADRGFFNLEVFADYAEQGIYWLSRLPAGVVIEDAHGRRGKTAEWLAGVTADRLDQEVWLGTRRLPCRLLAARVPEAVARKRQAKLLRQAKKKGVKVSAGQLALCSWNVCVTNLGGALLRPEEAWVLLRARWQIELLFKAWKSHGGLASTRGQRPERVLCELYAKLLAMLTQHWLVLASVGAPLGWSYPKVARRVRRQALAVAVALGSVAALVAVLVRLQRRAQRRCKLPSRTGRPSTYHLLLQPDRTDHEYLNEPPVHGEEVANAA
jgi:hypothetical protein